MLTHKGTQELKTSRLILRRYRISDAESMYKNYATDERVTKFLTWTPYQCIDDLRTWLTGTIQSYENNNVYHWAMEYEHQVIGAVSAMSLDFSNEKNRCCELGYSLSYDYWNKGFTSEAVKAVIKFLFEEVGMHRISAKHDAENPASGEVMKKCGMLYEGCLKDQYLRHDGTYSDALIYAIINKRTNEDSIRDYFYAWLNNNASVLTDLFDNDVAYSECYGPEYHGIEQIIKWFNDWNKRGRVVKWDIKRFVHEKNISVVEWYFECCYDGNVTGFDGVSIVEFNTSGKITSIREFQSKAEHYFTY